MIPSPILKVFSTLRAREVRCLLMGGQACVLYGAAEFSRDTDLAVLAEPDNLERFSDALRDLAASVIAVPPFEPGYLDRGHAVHFRCQADGAQGMRIDVMSRMRGVPEFPVLWERRNTFTLNGGDSGPVDVDVMALPDLVSAKKTRRDKDWPMIRRLVEAHYWTHQEQATSARVEFWLRELRTAALLVDCVRAYPGLAARVGRDRSACALALHEDVAGVEVALGDEMESERSADRAYWKPLLKEIEGLRADARRS